MNQTIAKLHGPLEQRIYQLERLDKVFAFIAFIFAFCIKFPNIILIL